MPIEEAADFFAAVPAIAPAMKTLVEVAWATCGWGSRRPPCPVVKRSASSCPQELQKRSTGRTVYVLDEPTTGLHFEDIPSCCWCWPGSSTRATPMLVIEHNLDVIKTADWLVDMGPEGGSLRGGMVVAEGTPETVAADPAATPGSSSPLLDGREAAQPAARRTSGRHRRRSSREEGSRRRLPRRRLPRRRLPRRRPPPKKAAPGAAGQTDLPDSHRILIGGRTRGPRTRGYGEGSTTARPRGPGCRSPAGTP